MKASWLLNSTSATLLGCILFANFLLSGCSSAPQAVVSRSFEDDIPADIKAVKERLDIKLVAQLERFDPFENLIKPPEPEVPEGVEGAEEAPAVEQIDPYKDIQLGGIFFREKGAKAIIRFGADKQSKILGVGDGFTSPAAEGVTIRVAQINKRHVKLVADNQPDAFKERIIEIASIVGYGNGGTDTAPKPTNDPAGKQYLVEDPDTLEIPNLILDLVKGDTRKNTPENIRKKHEEAAKKTS